MIRLTNLADYAVILMCEMSHADHRKNAQGLAASTSIPVPTVSKILNLLSRGQLLQSHRGIKGGFALSRAADKISVAEIVEAIDGPISLTSCGEDNEACSCGFDTACALRPRWQLINSAVRGALANVSLKEIAEPAIGSPVINFLQNAIDADKSP
jgi:FeS assembly SUF system regulator